LCQVFSIAVQRVNPFDECWQPTEFSIELELVCRIKANIFDY